MVCKVERRGQYVISTNNLKIACTLADLDDAYHVGAEIKKIKFHNT